MLLIIFFIVNLQIQFGDSARILGAVFTPSYSHQLVFRPIWEELARRGHQLTVLTTDPIKNSSLTNLNEIDLSFSYDILKTRNSDEILSSNKLSSIERFRIYMETLNIIADQQLSHPDVKNLIQNQSEVFDLLMVEVTYPTQMAFATRFNIPFIGLMSLDAPERIHTAIGNPTNPILYPNVNLPYYQNLSFRQRLISVFVSCLMSWYSNYRLYPREDLTIKKHFGDDMPSLFDIQKEISMLFLNVNPIFQKVRPLTPTTIQFGGGFHLNHQRIDPLPADIQQYLDGANRGFVYFSLGTNVKSASMTPELKQIILSALAELPYKVLWKFENENLENKPSNVKILKWTPQLSVLAHPNIKAFITQAGLQSIEEALFNNVPLVALPFFGDQFKNAEIIETKGLGIKLWYTTLKIEELKNAIIEVITNPKYKQNIQQTVELIQDVQISGLDKAVWWTEYVIRHNGTKHLRCPLADVPFYQYYCLDIIGFLLVIIYLFIKLLKLIFKSIYKLCVSNKIKQD